MEVRRIVLSDPRLPLVPLPSPRNLRTEDFYKEQREKEVADSEKEEWDEPMGKGGEVFAREAYELCEVIPSYRVGQSVRIAFYSCLAFYSLASMTFSRMSTSREESRLPFTVESI